MLLINWKISIQYLCSYEHLHNICTVKVIHLGIHIKTFWCIPPTPFIKFYRCVIHSVHYIQSFELIMEGIPLKHFWNIRFHDLSPISPISFTHSIRAGIDWWLDFSLSMRDKYNSKINPLHDFFICTILSTIGESNLLRSSCFSCALMAYRTYKCW